MTVKRPDIIPILAKAQDALVKAFPEHLVHMDSHGSYQKSFSVRFEIFYPEEEEAKDES